MKRGTLKCVEVRACLVWPRGGARDKVCEFTITDRTSGLQIASVTFTYEQFAELVSGNGATPGKAELFDVFATVGLIHEHKSEWFDIPGIGTSYDMPREEWDAIVRQHVPSELEGGWIPDYPRKGALSQGQLERDRIRVTYRRYVEPTA